MAKRLCKCGHRKYKHKEYPIDMPYCKGNNAPTVSDLGCRCFEYEPQTNLQYLEWKYKGLVGNNKIKGKL